MIRPEAIVTLERIDGFRIVRSLGVARGEASCPRSLLRSTFRTIGMFVGLAPFAYLTDAERIRKAALADLANAAERLGANGVVALQFDASERGDGSTFVRASGEAVVLEPSPGGAGG
jgi:uncharacterized protein YbjQ (UPF0145 family)